MVWGALLSTWVFVAAPARPELPDDLAVETTGDYVIVEAAPANAFETPAPRAIEFRAGAMLMVRAEAMRARRIIDLDESTIDNSAHTTFGLPTRLRAQLEARTDSFRMLAQVQDARTLSKPIGDPRAGFHQLFGEYHTSLRHGDLRFVFGRQEFVLGDAHLFAQAPWQAGARSWDGASLDFSSARGGVQLFAGSLARPFLSSKEPLVEHFKDQIALDWVLVGHYVVHTALRIEGLVWGTNRRDEIDTRKLVTTGLNLRGELAPGLEYAAEGQLQLGVIERLDLRQRHVAGHAFAKLDYLSPQGLGPEKKMKPGAFVLFDFASGTRCTTTEYDGLAPCTDGTSHDFDAAWMDQHRWFGYADRFRAQNIMDAAAGVRVQTQATEEIEIEIGATNHLFAFPQPGGRWHDANGERVGVAIDNRNAWAADEVDVSVELRRRWLTIDAGWQVVANLAGGRAVSGETIRQFIYLRAIFDLWSPWR